MQQSNNSFQAPKEVRQAAKIMLDNEPFNVLMSHYMNYLGLEVLHSVGDKEVLQAHTEYQAITAFGEWITAEAGKTS